MLAAALARAGFVAAEDEARELYDCVRGDASALDAVVRRRLDGEPLAWITGRTSFDGLDLRIDPGVYVPRWQSLELARRAVARLPEEGTAVDLCTGSGAVALCLQRARPRARVAATDADSRDVACARANGVDAVLGDLFDPLPHELLGAVDVVVAVTPYVPTRALRLLPRDTLAHEDVAHYDGGADGTAVMARVAARAPAFLRPGGSLLLEIGGDQAEALRPLLRGLGYSGVETWADDDGDVRGIQAVWPGQL
jgi:release factor glutamine methyltransferase